ncbi:MAG: TetR family transcriptional regulator [Candidatus Aminicenantes bacterium]|nr:TetR family transcriptional regulator [Candidatus Aminicenantes bacterium]
MERGEISTREKIILAAVARIEKEGIDSVTIRSIALEAGVNIASINYYFGSKEKLLEETLGQTAKEAFADPIEMLEDINKDVRISLQAVFSHFLKGSHTYPGLSRAHVYGPLLRGDYSGVFVKEYLKFLDHLYKKIKPFFPGTDPKSLKSAIVQALSVIIFLGLLPGLNKDFLKTNIKDKQIQEDFIRELIERLFPAPEAPPD